MIKNSTVFSKFFTLLNPHKKEIFIAFFALFLTALSILLFGKLAKYFIDFSQASNQKLFFSIFLILVATLSFAGYLRSKIINSICFKLGLDLRQRVYQNIIKISPQFFEEQKIGDIISRISSDIDKVCEILSGNIAFFLRNLLLFFASLIFLLVINIKLTLISIFLIFLAILPIFIFAKKIKNLSKESSFNRSEINSEVEESIYAIKVIQSSNQQEKAIKNFAAINENSLDSDLKKSALKSLLVAATIFFAFLAIAIILFVGIDSVKSMKMTSGDFSSFVFYAVIASVSSVGIGQIFTQIQTLKTSLERIFFLIEAKSVIKESANPLPKITSDSLDISFEKVNFSYKDKKILSDFNLEIKQGQKIAIIGESGIGKSTIFSLLLRFHDIDLGKISINNNDIKDMSLFNLRENFSYVSQDNFIFSGTIFDNISYANKNFSRQKIQQIIDANKAFHFINEMPQKLDTNLAQKGVKLSGGQKQRIAILRALIKNAKILLFDEATSALDKENEDLILQLINEYAKNKTLIMVSHKITKAIKFDKIIDLSKP